MNNSGTTENPVGMSEPFVPDASMREHAIALTRAVVDAATFEPSSPASVASVVSDVYRQMLKLIIVTTANSGEWHKLTPPPGLSEEETAEWADGQM